MRFWRWGALRIADVVQQAFEQTAREAREARDRYAHVVANDWALRFIHDHVLSLLRLAAAGEPPVRLRPAITEIRHRIATAAEETPRTVTGDALVVDITASAARLGADVTSAGDLTQELPVDVARVLTDAAAEALRNAARHAPGARVAVSIVVGEAGVTVQITDDGPGFSSSQVPASSFGIRGSIVAPVAAVGGHAEIVSTPGAGTEVRLRWGGSAAGPLAGHSGSIAEAINPPSLIRQMGWAPFVVLAVMIISLALVQLPALAHPLLILIGSVGVGLSVYRYAADLRSTGRVAVRTMLVCSCGCVVVFMGMAWPAADASSVWALALVTLLCGMAAASGQLVLGWGFTAIIYALTSIFLVRAGQQHLLLELLRYMIQPITATAVHLFAVRGEKGIDAVLEREATTHARTSRDDAMLLVQSQLSNRIRVAVGDLFVIMTEKDELSDVERERCSLAQAELRDWVRGGRLVDESVRRAVAWARKQGAAVTLLDDSGGVALPVPDEMLRDMVVRELGTVAQGQSATFRLFPPGRKTILSFSIEGNDRDDLELWDQQRLAAQTIAWGYASAVWEGGNSDHGD